MNIKLSLAARNAMGQALVTEMGTGAVVNFYSGSIPSTTGGAITSQTLIATCALSSVAGSVSAGAVTFSAVSDDISADATATIGFGRILNGSGAFFMDADAGISSSSPFWTFNTTGALQGGLVRINSAVLNINNG